MAVVLSQLLALGHLGRYAVIAGEGAWSRK